MDYYAMTDIGVAKEIGNRVRELRLRKNLTQLQLANAICVSRPTIDQLEKGNAKISTLIAVLRELNQLDALDMFLPEIPISPMQLAQQQGKKRVRAAGKRSTPKGGTEW